MSPISLWRSLLRKEFLRYLVTGSTLFMLDLCTFMMLTQWFSQPVAVSQLISRAVGAAAGFVGHRFFTYGSSVDAPAMHVGKQGIGYVLVAVAGFLLSPLVVLLMLKISGGHLVVAKVLAEVILVLMTYVALRQIFRKKE